MQRDKLINSIILGVLLILGTSCATPTVLQSHYNKGDSLSDSLYINTQANFFSRENDLSLKLFHSSSSLDIIIETNNPATVNKIVTLGLEIWIDPRGKSHRKLGINYPLPLNNPTPLFHAKDRGYKGVNTLNIQKKYDQWFKELELVNFTPGETIIIPCRDNGQEVIASLTSTPNILLRYHLTIPISRIYDYVEPSSVALLSIGINSLNESEGEYSSSLSSKEVVRRRMQTLKAGKSFSRELTEQWINFELRF